MRVFTFIAVCFAALTAPSLSYGYPIDHSLGFGLGYTWTESEFNDPIRQLNAETETPSYSSVSTSSRPFNLYSNFRFHKYYGVELGYINYGKIKFDKSLIKTKDLENSPIIESRIREATINASGLYLNHVIYVPVSERFLLQAKVGLIIGSIDYSDIETLTIEPQDTGSTQQISSSVTSNSESLTNVQLAAALVYQSSADTAWRLQVSQIDFSHDSEKEAFTQWFSQISYEIKL
jgi:hypothetical protein